MEGRAWAGSVTPDSSEETSAPQPPSSLAFKSRRKFSQIKIKGSFLSKEVKQGKPSDKPEVPPTLRQLTSDI